MQVMINNQIVASSIRNSPTQLTSQRRHSKTNLHNWIPNLQHVISLT